jgi:site-specific DNA recombinase
MKTVILARVSSREQDIEGYSLPAQEKLLKNYSERKELDITKIYSISESASGSKQRQVFSEMMEYVKKNDIKIIVCEKVDRLTRNFKDAVMIDEWLEEDEERQVHLVKDGLVMHKNSRSQEKLNWGIRIIFAKNYIDNLSEEVRKGQTEKISQGWFPKEPPSGYKSITEGGHKIHAIDEKMAPLAVKMFEMCNTGGYSVVRIADELTKLGFRTTKTIGISKSQVHKLLTNPFYCGWFNWNKKLYKGKHEPLISQELFDSVQRILKGGKAAKYSKHLFLFNKLLTCSECSGGITWEKQKGLVYGHCFSRECCSKTSWIREDALEEKILPTLNDFKITSPRLQDWIRRALKESYKDEVETNTAVLNSLQEKLNLYQNRLNKLYDDKLDNKYSEDFISKKFAEYTKEKENILGEMKKYSQSSDKQRELGVNIYDLSQKASLLFSKAELEEKRNLLHMVFENLKLSNGGLVYKYNRPYEILLKAIRATQGSKMMVSVFKKDENFELGLDGAMTMKKEVSDLVYPIWLGMWDDFRTFSDVRTLIFKGL